MRSPSSQASSAEPEAPPLMCVDADHTSEVMAMLATQVSHQFQQWKQARARLEQTWQACWDAYLCQPNAAYMTTGEDAAYRSQVVRPVLFEAAEVIHSF